MFPTENSIRIIGAILLCFMFFVSGINKIFHFASTKQSLINKVPKWPLPHISIVVVIIIEVICPIIIIYSLLSGKMKQITKICIAVMIGFVILVTLIYHPPNITKKYMSNVAFFSNMSVTGGLLTLYSVI